MTAPPLRSPVAADVSVLAEGLRPALLRIGRLLRRQAQPLGLSPLDATLLTTVGKREGVGVSELAELERSQQLTRLPIAVEYIRRSGLNVIAGSRGTTGERRARIGLVAAGKTYLDLRQALTTLGLGDDELERRGIRLLKLGVIYPLEPSIVTEFAAGLDEIIVIEDKRAFLEDAVKSALYGQPAAPAVYGKRSQDGAALFSAVGELDADSVADGLARHFESAGIPVKSRPPRERGMLPLAQRQP